MSDTHSEQGDTSGKAWFNGAELGDLKPCDDASGWPEFQVTIHFYVATDDPQVAERERQRIWDELPDLLIDADHA